MESYFPFFSILFLHLLQISWMTCWIQSPTLVYKMTLLMAMSEKQLCILFNMVYLVFGFLLPLLQNFPMHGYLLPTSWNIMVIQNTKGTCKLSPNLMWEFSMFIIIKSNLIKGRFIHWTFTFVASLRRWIWWGSGSLRNTNNGFNDFRSFNILLFFILISCMLMILFLQSGCKTLAFLMNTIFTSLR